jgi:hypothetical protein
MDAQFITRDLLDEVGIELGDQDIDGLLLHLNSTLEERVGAEVTESLDDEELKAFLDLQENASDEELSAWLELNVPELQEIVQDEIDILLGELAESTDAINES